MKKHCVAALCCLLLAGCTKPVTRQVGEGQVAFACELLDAVGVTRSTTRPLPEGSVPASSDLKLVLSGTESEPLPYETMADYDMPMLTAGDYSARFTYGDPTAEGAGKSYFEGSCSFAVVARKTITQPVTVALANSLYTLSLSEWFGNYYTDYDLTVRTEAGLQTRYAGQSSEAQESEPVFVQAGTALYLSGTAVKTNGVEVSFPETLIGRTTARTWHTLSIDAGSVGQTGLIVSLDDMPVAIEEIPVELNPEA